MEELKLRVYQERILNTCSKNNTLVVLPTGTGKTFIALGMTLLKLMEGKGRVFFLAPTKPLAKQHEELFRKYIDENDMVCLTGSVAPAEREMMYKEKKVFFETPQTLENDIITRKVDLSGVSLIIFDECHHAIGEYAYVFIAQEYMKQSKHPHLLGMSASPGSDFQKIKEVMANLSLDKVEHVDKESPLIKDYVNAKKINRVVVNFPENLLDAKKSLEEVLRENLRELKYLEFIESADISKVRKSGLLKLQAKIRGSLNEEKRPILFQALKYATICIKVVHSMELLETHGPKTTLNYFSKLKKQAERTKSAKMLLNNLNFKKAMSLIDSAVSNDVRHPKFDKLKEIVMREFMKNKDSKIIIFTMYRDTTRLIKEELQELGFCRPEVFVGQKDGMTQKKQLEVIGKFKNSEFNTLIATSVAEEGIHVDNCDLGIFFEPMPSALKMIQRRGRIGRTNIGKVFVLMTRGCIDEKYFWVSKHKEKRMALSIENIRKGSQKSLDKFFKE